MEKAIVKALLEKYWRAETTLEEERQLAEYFRTAGGDAELEPYDALFAYFEEEINVMPSDDLEARILGSITPVRHFSWSMVAAAAAILVVVGSLFLLDPGKSASPIQPRTVVAVTDTYDNPEQALAAVRHALLIASNHLNEGKQIINK
jgi:hypothetical protein